MNLEDNLKKPEPSRKLQTFYHAVHTTYPLKFFCESPPPYSSLSSARVTATLPIIQKKNQERFEKYFEKFLDTPRRNLYNALLSPNENEFNLNPSEPPKSGLC